MAKETVVITPYRIGQAHLVGKYDDRNLGVTVLITKDMQVKTSFTPADEKTVFHLLLMRYNGHSALNTMKNLLT